MCVGVGECCGPMKATMGAKPGIGSQLCGSMMYSEILAAKPQTYSDNVTKTTIGYLATAGADGYTEAGTWMTYNDLDSVKEVVKWEIDQVRSSFF